MSTPRRVLFLASGLAQVSCRPGPTYARRPYTRPYQMHASIGPSAALAEWRDGALTIWSHSQGIFVLRLAQALGIDVENVRAIHVPGPGCYGHNGADGAAQMDA